MTANEKHDLCVWWWGRKLPEELSGYSNLSSLTDSDYKLLGNFKEVYEQAQEKGTELDWGYQVTIGQVVIGRLA